MVTACNLQVLSKKEHHPVIDALRTKHPVDSFIEVPGQGNGPTFMVFGIFWQAL